MKARWSCRSLEVIFCSGVLLTSLSGCGSRGRDLPKAPVSGTVSYSKSFPHGEVIFMHSSGELAVARFDEDGTYQVEVAQGPNRVSVRAQTSSHDESEEKGARPVGMELYTNHIPMRYGDFNTSKLEINVEPGENTFDIPLKD